MRIYRQGELETRYVGYGMDTWKKAYMRVESNGKDHRIQYLADWFSEKISVKSVLNCLGTEHLVARADGYVFHCSYISRDGKAILFTAPSETGKSTQADLWHTHRGAQIVNGDRAVVRLADGQVIASGIPFAGSSSHCENQELPVQAIVYLAQAPETTISKLRGYQAFSRIWEGISVNTWDAKDMELVSRAVQITATQVPVFYMPCTPDESAVIALEQALRELEEG